MRSQGYTVVHREHGAIREAREREVDGFRLRDLEGAIADRSRCPGEIEVRVDDPNPHQTIQMLLAEDFLRAARDMCRAMATHGIRSDLEIRVAHDDLLRAIRQHPLYLQRGSADGSTAACSFFGVMVRFST